MNLALMYSGALKPLETCADAHQMCVNGQKEEEEVEAGENTQMKLFTAQSRGMPHGFGTLSLAYKYPSRGCPHTS